MSGTYSSSHEYPQGALQEDRFYEPRKDPEQEEARREILSEANVAARHDILFICIHHGRGPRQAYDEKVRPRRCLLAHADCSVTWEPLPEGL